MCERILTVIIKTLRGFPAFHKEACSCCGGGGRPEALGTWGSSRVNDCFSYKSAAARQERRHAIPIFTNQRTPLAILLEYRGIGDAVLGNCWKKHRVSDVTAGLAIYRFEVV